MVLAGIVENIAAIWMVLCATYEDGDKIFIFGFSRGAYTARILASLVTTFGLLVRLPLLIYRIGGRKD
jgi:uncharacterized protein (DUF2235 family)